jgi:DNA primase
MAFPPGFLDELRERVSLGDLIGRRVKLVRRGREQNGLCPFHSEKTPSFTVSEEKGFYHCFGCGAHGDAISFVMQTEALSFPEAVEKLAGLAGLQVPVSSPEERERARRRADLFGVLEAACTWFEKQLHMPVGRAALAYLDQRGLDQTTIARFRLGFAPEARGALKVALAREDVAEAQLVEAGLLKLTDDGGSYDYFRKRIIFPITDRRGRVIAFGGRALGDREPKYLNSPETPMFQKGKVLYGLAQAREAARDTGEVIVTEGYMDVIALNRAGFAQAVAPLGTAVTEDQIELLWRLAPEPVLCFDGDAAGQRAAARAAERALPRLKPGHSLRFATLPPSEDPDSLVRNQGSEAMRRILDAAAPLADVIWRIETAGRNLATPERQALIDKRLHDRINRIADGTVRNYYRNIIRSRLRESFAGPRRTGPRDRQRDAFVGGSRAQIAPQPRLRDHSEVVFWRGQQILVATLINHPELIDELGEAFSRLELPAGDLDKLRQEVLKLVASSQNLDAEGLKTQLRLNGLGTELDSVLRPDVYLHGRFARPDASIATAREGWLAVFEEIQKVRLQRENSEALKIVTRNPTDQELERFHQRQLQLQRSENDRALNADEKLSDETSR